MEIASTHRRGTLAVKSKSADPVGMEDDAIKICEEESRDGYSM